MVTIEFAITLSAQFQMNDLILLKTPSFSAVTLFPECCSLFVFAGLPNTSFSLSADSNFKLCLFGMCWNP